MVAVPFSGSTHTVTSQVLVVTRGSGCSGTTRWNEAVRQFPVTAVMSEWVLASFVLPRWKPTEMSALSGQMVPNWLRATGSDWLPGPVGILLDHARLAGVTAKVPDRPAVQPFMYGSTVTEA